MIQIIVQCIYSLSVQRGGLGREEGGGVGGRGIHIYIYRTAWDTHIYIYITSSVNENPKQGSSCSNLPTIPLSAKTYTSFKIRYNFFLKYNHPPKKTTTTTHTKKQKQQQQQHNSAKMSCLLYDRCDQGVQFRHEQPVLPSLSPAENRPGLWLSKHRIF